VPPAKRTSDQRKVKRGVTHQFGSSADINETIVVTDPSVLKALFDPLRHRIVKELEDSYDRGEFKHLVVVAPQRSLGEFRSIAPDKLLRVVWREVPKELTQFTAHELESRLKPFLEPETEIVEPPPRR